MRKVVVVFLSFMVVVNLISLPVYANTVEKETGSIKNAVGEQEYQMSSLEYETYDANGNLIDASYECHTDSYAISASTIPAGGTRYYFPSDNANGFLMGKDCPVTVALTLNKAAKIRISLTKGTSKTTTDKNPKVTLIPSETGRMKVAIKNESSESITIKSGTISW